MRNLQQNNLIHLLIQYDSNSQSEDMKAHRLTALNRQAISLFDAAYQEAGRDFSPTAHYFDKEKLAIKKRVLAELELSNLVNEQQFNAMNRAIKAWPLSKSYPAHRQCQKVRQMLISVVPQMIQKKKLLRICSDYKTHLQEDIEAELCKNHIPHIVQFVDDNPNGIANGSESLNSAIKKYAAIHSMHSTLTTPERIETQITHFKQEFFSKRSMIEKDRDSQAVKFVKTIATVLSLGIAHVLGIWNVKGRIVAHDIQTVLNA